MTRPIEYPHDMIFGLPNCGLVGMAIVTNTPLLEVTEWYRVTFKMRAWVAAHAGKPGDTRVGLFAIRKLLEEMEAVADTRAREQDQARALAQAKEANRRRERALRGS